MIAIVHSIYSQSVHALALDAGLMDNDAERYCISKPYSASNICLFPGEFHHLQNFCVNLFIDLQNELKLAQILSLQPVYPQCYIFHPLYVNGGVLYFM